MSRKPVDTRPTRKTLVTGQSLPRVETEYRPIPVGYDENGDPDGQIRAFAVLIRNRSDSAVEVREGPTDDSNTIDPGESYRIWETDGVNKVSVRGTEGGETLEFRTLEAHNDFSFSDKIDAFIRSITHFFGTSSRQTEVTAIGDTVTIDDIEAGTVDVGTFSDKVTIDDIEAGSVDANITNSELTVDSVAGGLDANVAGSVAIDDITGQTTTLDIAGSVDASGSTFDVDNIIRDPDAFDNILPARIDDQTEFDLTTTVREGQTVVESWDAAGLSAGTQDDDFNLFGDYYNTVIRDVADYDGRIDRIEARFYDYSQVDDLGFELGVDYGSTGSYTVVSPRATGSARDTYELAGDGTDLTTTRYFPNSEVVTVWEPTQPPRFEAGDSVAIQIGPLGDTTAGDGDYDVEIEVTTTDIVTQE